MKIPTLRSPVIRKQFILGALALICGLFSSCATSSYQEPQRPSYSESQVSKWKSYLRVSPLSNDISPHSSSVRAEVNSELPERYNAHIREVANHIDRTAVAQQRYAEEVARISGNYELSKRVAPGIGSAAYKMMRGQDRNETIGDVFGNLLARWTAEGIVESRYRSQMQEAAETIMKPVIENGKGLVLAEDVLTRDMRVAPTRQLSQKVQAIADDHYRQLVPGVWKESTLLVTHKVWLFSSDGYYEFENPLTSSTESGRWSISDRVLKLKTRFGSTDYRITQEGKGLVISRLDSGAVSKLAFVSSDSSTYRQLLRSLKGGNVRYNYSF